MVGQPQGLVIDVPVAVARHAKKLEHAFATPSWPVMHPEHQLGTVTPQLDRSL